MAFPRSSCLVQRWRCDLSLCPVQTKFRFPQFWLLDKSQFSSSKGALSSLLTEGTNVVPINIPKCSLVCGLPQDPKSPALLTSLHRKLPASPSPYYPAVLTMSSLGLFFVSFFHSPALPSATVSPGQAQSAGHVPLTTLSLSALDSTRCF